MVVDKFENLEKYASLNPLFAEGNQGFLRQPI